MLFEWWFPFTLAAERGLTKALLNLKLAFTFLGSLFGKNQ